MAGCQSRPSSHTLYRDAKAKGSHDNGTEFTQLRWGHRVVARLVDRRGRGALATTVGGEVLSLFRLTSDSWGLRPGPVVAILGDWRLFLAFACCRGWGGRLVRL